jgi:Homeodomain-like domain
MWTPCVCGGIAGWDCKGSSLVTLSLAERLHDAPRPGVKPKFSSEQRSQMAALACEAPAQCGRPISQWTGREIADELKARGIVEQIAPRHAARLLTKGDSNRTASATG